MQRTARVLPPLLVAVLLVGGVRAILDRRGLEACNAGSEEKLGFRDDEWEVPDRAVSWESGPHMVPCRRQRPAGAGRG